MLATALAPQPQSIRISPSRPVARPVAGESLAQLLSIGSVRDIEVKEHIFREGDPASHIYFVEFGNVCIYKMMPDGRRQVIDFAYAGDTIALGAIGQHAANAQATTPTRVRCLSAATLHQVMGDNSRMGVMVYEALSRELLAAREMLFTVSQRTAKERVAAFLMALSHRNARNGQDASDFVLPMNRTDIADFLGLTIETVSRTFTKLRAEGLIDLSQSVLVTIVDHEALAKLAEGEAE